MYFSEFPMVAAIKGGPTNQRRLLNESININTQTEAGGSTQLKRLLIRVTLWPPLIRDAARDFVR